MFRGLNIHNKLALILWGSALLALAVAGAAFAIYGRVTLKDRALQHMEPYAQLVSIGAEAAVAFEDPVRAREVLNTLRANPHILEATLLLEDGSLLAHYSRNAKAKPPIQAPITPAGGIHLTKDTAELIQDLRRGGRLSLTLSLDALGRRSKESLWILGAGMLVLLAITFGQLIALDRSIIRPISTLANVAEQVRARGYDDHRPLALSGTDEIARLEQVFHAMMAAVRERETELRRLTLFQRTLLDNAAYGIISMTPDGIISSFNPAAERLLGYSADEVIGKKTPRCWHDPVELERRARQMSDELGETIKPDIEVLTARARRGLADECEWTYLRKDGSSILVLRSVSALRDEHGRVTGFVSLSSDLTERKSMEAQYYHAQKMEAIGQLAGGVAHDFNNILAATMLRLGVLQMEPNLGASTLSSLKELTNYTQRAANLTRQLLVFSRRQAMNVQAVEVNQLLENLFKMLRRLLSANIDFSFTGTNEPLWIDADSGMIEQVVMNLCLNARDAMPKGGQLTIRTGGIMIDPASVPKGKPGGWHVCITVSDTGCGMDETTRRHIFEPFFTTKPEGKGTGLGLATAYGIVEQHLGWIQVESVVGRGSSFRVLLPVARNAPQAEAKPSAPLLPGGTETILLVEDEEALRAMVALCLGQLGYQVKEAVNAADALEKWRDLGSQVDLLFTDMVMPGGITGLALAERLREVKPSLKVILASGYNAEILDTSKAAWRNITYLPKPFEIQKLLGTVREVLDRGPADRQA